MAIYSDIDIELTKAQDGDILRDEEEEAIKNSLINIINTPQGSRRMLPEFAVDVYGLLFEPMDDTTANEIGRRMLDGIETWDDRIVIENINVHSNFDIGQYEITIDYRVRTTETAQTVEFILKQG